MFTQHLQLACVFAMHKCNFWTVFYYILYSEPRRYNSWVLLNVMEEQLSCLDTACVEFVQLLQINSQTLLHFHSNVSGFLDNFFMCHVSHSGKNMPSITV